MSNDEQINFSSTSKKRKDVMAEAFEFGYTTEKDKFAKCKLCFEKDETVKIIKMKDGNTVGTNRHLKMYHKEYFAKAFPDKSSATSEVTIKLIIIKLKKQFVFK